MYKRQFIMIFIIVFALMGCSIGGNLHKEIQVDGFTLHIVGSSDMLPCGTFGCQSGNEIWVVGYELKTGEIWIPTIVLGHELKHLLHKRGYGIKDAIK